MQPKTELELKVQSIVGEKVSYENTKYKNCNAEIGRILSPKTVLWTAE
jgi:hypothetical protein